MRVATWKIYATIIGACALVYGIIYFPEIRGALNLERDNPSNVDVGRNNPEITDCDPRAESGVIMDTGWKYPGTINAIALTNPDNIKLDDGAYANGLITPDYTSVAMWAYNFNFGVPTGATITNIDVMYKVYKTGTGNAKENDIRIVNPYPALQTGNAATFRLLTGTATTYTILGTGNPTAQYGATPSTTQVNNAGFGWLLGFENDHPTDNATVFVDFMAMKIYYTPGTTYGTGAGALPGLTGKAHHRVN